MFFEYGDDSVAQLGGVHLACEQASNLLTKVLEWGRLMSYLEQSTRYIAYDSRIGGRYRYYRDPLVLGSSLGTRYVGDMDRLFDTYGELIESVTEHVRATTPKDPADSDFVFRQATRAKALDAVRGILPAASISNVGIYGTGQGFEALLLRMRSHLLPEARHYAELMLHELRKVIPSFLRRVDLPDRGGAWSDYLAATRDGHGVDGGRDLRRGRGRARARRDAHRLGSRRRGQAARGDLLPVHRPARSPGPGPGPVAGGRRPPLAAEGVRGRPVEPPPQARPGLRADRLPLRRAGRLRGVPRPPAPSAPHDRVAGRSPPATATCGPRPSTRPGRPTPSTPPWPAARSLYEAIAERFPATQAAYAVSMAYRVRFAMQFNAREAVHLLELRTGSAGHPAYRQVCLEMHRLIAEQAGHRAIAAAMVHVDHTEPELARLEGERRAEARRLGQ